MGLLPVYCTHGQLEEEVGGMDEKMSVYGYTLSATVPLESGMRVIVDLVWRKRLMRVFQKSMKTVVRRLQKYELGRFFIITR